MIFFLTAASQSSLAQGHRVKRRQTPIQLLTGDDVVDLLFQPRMAVYQEAAVLLGNRLKYGDQRFFCLLGAVLSVKIRVEAVDLGQTDGGTVLNGRTGRRRLSGNKGSGGTSFVRQ